MAFRRPIFSDHVPKKIPPSSAPMLAMIAISPTVCGVKCVVFLQKCRIQILRAVAERIESKHQHDQESENASISQNVVAQLCFLRACETRPCNQAGDSSTLVRI